MCASYGLEVTSDALLDGFSFDEKRVDERLYRTLETLREKPARITGSKALNFNPIVRNTSDGRQVDLAWWWLWLRGTPARFNAFNSRDDRLLGPWASSFRSRRALVPATHYIEKGVRFDLDGQLFAIAGIWAPTAPDAPTPVSYSLVTTSAIERFAAVHGRQPVLVPPDLYDDWLNPGREGDQELLDEVVFRAREISESMRMIAA